MSRYTHTELLAQQSSFHFANNRAASRCSAALAELLHPEATTHIIQIQSERPALGTSRGVNVKAVKYEIGFGSIAADHHEPALRLAALKDLLMGAPLEKIPLLLPLAPSASPLSAALSQAFPILIRGSIDCSELVLNRDELQSESFSRPLSPYREARGTLRALNVEEIRLLAPCVADDSEFSGAVTAQLNQRLAELRNFFLRDQF